MARQRPVATESDDVFEDSAPPAPQPSRRRASAADYNAAYREAEEGFEEPRRRSGGPWLLLFALLLAAVATGGIVWYYQTKIKPVASIGTGTPTENVPVVAAPEGPAKTAAETPPEQPLNVQPANKKQIYDRIVGDQEVSGEQLVPTEQTPIQPENQTSGQTNSEAIPAPASTQTIDDTEPLPLPPPPGETGSGTQGNLNNTEVQPAASETAYDAPAADSIGALATETATDTAAAVGTQATQPVEQPAKQETASSQNAQSQSESIGQEAEAPAVKVPETKKAPAPAKKAAANKTKTMTEDNQGVEPLVLVPPSQDAGLVDLGGVSAPSEAVSTGTAETPAPKRKKTIFDLFKGDASQADETAQPQTQVASTTAIGDHPAETPAQPAQQTTGGSGYVAQLASFRSQGEAQAEYGRLKAKYPGIIGGLEPSISTATVAGSTRYRLGLGPMAAREDASKICGSLLASGERDCIVRKQ